MTAPLAGVNIRTLHFVAPLLPLSGPTQSSVGMTFPKCFRTKHVVLD